MSDNEREKPKYSLKNLSQCQFIHHNSQVDCLGIDSAVRRRRLNDHSVKYEYKLSLLQETTGEFLQDVTFDMPETPNHVNHIISLSHVSTLP
jgi:hypothetical protein